MNVECQKNNKMNVERQKIKMDVERQKNNKMDVER